MGAEISLGWCVRSLDFARDDNLVRDDNLARDVSFARDDNLPVMIIFFEMAIKFFLFSVFNRVK